MIINIKLAKYHHVKSDNPQDLQISHYTSLKWITHHTRFIEIYKNILPILKSFLNHKLAEGISIFYGKTLTTLMQARLTK